MQCPARQASRKLTRGNRCPHVLRSSSSLLFAIDVHFFFASRRRHTRLVSDWSSDVCSSDLGSCNNDPTLSLSDAMLVLAVTLVGSLLQLPGVGGGSQAVSTIAYTKIFLVKTEEIGRASCRERV